MKTIVRYLLAALALGAIGFQAGCANTPGGKIAKVSPLSFEIRVVNSSSGRRLPPGEMDILRANLLRYLSTQGELVTGTKYFLRVEFEPEKPGEPGEWLVVEVTSPQAPAIQVATYTSASPYYYPSYAGAGYSNYYGSYYDPYEYSSSYGGYSRPATVVPPQNNRPHDRDGDRSHDRNNNDRSHDWNGNDHSSGTYAGGSGRDRDHRPRSGDYTPRTDDSPRSRDSGGREPTTSRVTDNSSSSGGNSGGSSYTPPSAPSYSPPSEPVRSESSNTGVQRDSAQKEEN